MIVRILNEGQWELSDDAVTATLSRLDDAVEQAVTTGDQAGAGRGVAQPAGAGPLVRHVRSPTTIWWTPT